MWRLLGSAWTIKQLIVCVGPKRGEMGAKQERKSNRWLIAIVILLLITVCVLLWLLLRPMEPKKTPTGKVDVFDIRIGYICRGNDADCLDDEDDFIPYVAPARRGATNNSEKKVNGETDTEEEREGIVYVDDENGRYVYQKSLKIFENPAFEYTNKIAPGVSNSYEFKVHNETDGAIRYDIEFVEKSEYDINMLYRLRRGGAYVVGGDTKWVRAVELSSALKDLDADGVDGYVLDWQWPYESGNDALDTTIGENMTSKYSLSIKINFEEAVGEGV